MILRMLRGRLRSVSSAVLVSLSGASALHAEPVPVTDDALPTWQIVFTPYVWALSIDGEIESRRVDADVDADFSDIIDETNIAVMAILEARRGRWAIVLDSVFAEIESDDSMRGPLQLDTRLRQSVIDAKLGYRVWESASSRAEESTPRANRAWLAIDVLGGARYVRSRNEIDARLAQLGREVDETFDWVDGVLGWRLRADVTATTSLALTGDVGGFGVGSSSDLTWSAIAAFTWHPSRRWSVSAGYKALDIDRDQVDLVEHGPVLGLSYAF